MPLRTYYKGESTNSFVDYLFQKKRTKFFLFGISFLFLVLFSANIFTLVRSPQQEIARPIAQNSEVKGAIAELSPTLVPTSTPSPTPQPTATPTPKPIKTSYKIAIIGDSMVDTMGEVLEYLEHSLKKKYPDINFGLYNYGQGSVNIAEGLDRFGKEFSYSSRSFLAVNLLQPDIMIIGSYAYNPFSPYDRDRHWITLTKLVEEAERTSAKVYMLAEIAPLRSDFGRGPNGVNWEPATAYTHSGHIIEQLENAVALSKILNVPLINVFEKTYDKTKKEGKREYVNFSDGIHPSVEGHELTADTITETIKLK